MNTNHTDYLNVGINLNINLRAIPRNSSWTIQQNMGGFSGNRDHHYVTFVDLSGSEGGFWQKTAHFGRRFLSGAIGSCIPVIMIAAAMKYSNRFVPNQFVNCLSARRETLLGGVATTGLISAAAASHCRQSFIYGGVIGTAAAGVVALTVHNNLMVWIGRQVIVASQKASDAVSAVQNQLGNTLSGTSNAVKNFYFSARGRLFCSKQG